MPRDHIFWLSSSMGFVPVLEPLHRFMVVMDRKNPHRNSSGSDGHRGGKLTFLRPVQSTRELCRTLLVFVGLSGEQYIAQLPELLLVWKDDSRIEKTFYWVIKDDKAELK